MITIKTLRELVRSSEYQAFIAQVKKQSLAPLHEAFDDNEPCIQSFNIAKDELSEDIGLEQLTSEAHADNHHFFRYLYEGIKHFNETYGDAEKLADKKAFFEGYEEGFEDWLESGCDDNEQILPKDSVQLLYDLKEFYLVKHDPEKFLKVLRKYRTKKEAQAYLDECIDCFEKTK